MISALIVVALSASAQSTSPATQAGPPPPDCKQLLVSQPTGDIAALCRAEDAMRLAAATAAGSPERLEHLRAAADGYARAARTLQNLELKVYAYEAIVRVHDSSHLNDPRPAEQALRQLATLVAGTPAPLVRLAKFQEGHDAADRAEHTLLGARQQYPGSLAVLRELSAFFARRVVATLTSQGYTFEIDGTVRQRKPPEPRYRPDCQQVPIGDPSTALEHLCAAEAETRKATMPDKVVVVERRGDTVFAYPADNTEALKTRAQHLRTAAGHYERAVAMFRELDRRAFAYDALVRVYGADNLNLPVDAEQAVRQLMALTPDSTAPIIRLAALHEEQTFTDAAEATLQSARQQFPEDVEPIRALSKFYARLSTAASIAENRGELDRRRPAANATASDLEAAMAASNAARQKDPVPDDSGFYTGVGRNLREPKRDNHIVAQYPREAKAAGIGGVVLLDVFISETGQVVDVRLLQSIPMLDDAAMAAVKQWQYRPAVVNGRAVPFRTTVSIRFTPPAEVVR